MSKGVQTFYRFIINFYRFIVFIYYYEHKFKKTRFKFK